MRMKIKKEKIVCLEFSIEYNIFTSTIKNNILRILIPPYKQLHYIPTPLLPSAHTSSTREKVERVENPEIAELLGPPPEIPRNPRADEKGSARRGISLSSSRRELNFHMRVSERIDIRETRRRSMTFSPNSLYMYIPVLGCG